MSTVVSRRSFLAFCFWTIMAAVAPRGAWAYERKEHDRITEEILFGQPYMRMKKPGVIKALESAVYLCADQMDGEGDDDLERLQKEGVPNLPKLSDIDLTKEHIALLDKKIFGYHDALTHMGWHFDYAEGDALEGLAYREVRERVQDGYGEEWPKRWKRRKHLLVNAVAHLLDFGLIERGRAAIGWSDGSRSDAFAELLYCVHVLGDYEDKIQDNLKKEKYEMKLLAIPFAVKGAGEDNRDLFWDLEEAVGILFDNKSTREEYERLACELEKRAEMARCSTTVASKTSAETFRRHVLQTKRILKQNIPDLLTKSAFFSDAI